VSYFIPTYHRVFPPLSRILAGERFAGERKREYVGRRQIVRIMKSADGLNDMLS
jgi:hypothetical protein